MIKTDCKRFDTAREYLEESIRIQGSDVFYYIFNEHGHRITDVWNSQDANRVDDAQEMIEIALKYLEKFGFVCFDGLGGPHLQLEGGYNQCYGCKIDNTPRATKIEIAMLARLNELAAIIRKRRDEVKTRDERLFYFRGVFRVSRFLSNLKKEYDWRDEMFRENGLVGLRNVNGDILVPCGDYDFIHGCDYWDDTSLAIASRSGMYGLIKRDGKGTAVTPFKYENIERLDYNKAGVATSKRYNVHIGYRKVSYYIVADIIVNGQVIVSDAGNFFTGRGGIEFDKIKEGKISKGFLGIYWDWILVEDNFDDMNWNDEQPYFTFVKNGEEGVLTTDKEFIPLEKWNSMTDDEQDEQWENIIGCLRLDFTSPIAITD